MSIGLCGCRQKVD